MRIITFVLLLAAGLTLAFSNKQPLLIKGMITDEKGAPVSGATIKVKNSKKITTSDTAGNFHLPVDAIPVTLEVNMIGFDPQTFEVNHKNSVWVMLKASTTSLQEVVVTGYASTKKRSVTGSVSTIKSSNIQPQGTTYLAGKAAGVSVLKSKRAKDKFSKTEDKEPEIEFSREGYEYITENRFQKVKDHQLSTFSIDVDAASYSNVRRFLNAGQLPPAGAIRIEEMINYFNYNYPQPIGEDPFGIHTEVASSPWNKNHRLVMIGLQGKKIPTENLPASNLVFLIDVSGSMEDENKLPLVVSSLSMLTEQLRPQDNVAIVVYAGAAGLVLPSTSGSDKSQIKSALDRLQAGGSTAGSAGIQLAYDVARKNFKEGGNNRVILCTDGDFNVGASSDDALERLIEKERKSGVFLTVLGYGMGNYQDAKMQKLADKGNGNHAYIDQLSEAKKVLVNEFGGTLFTIAKDVKLQVEFNPDLVQGYRLIGYENRVLAKEDFNNDKKDAGDMGSGHTVTALYEIIPVGVAAPELDSVDALKYVSTGKGNAVPGLKISSSNSSSNEMLTIKVRYKKPDADQSKLMVYPVKLEQKDWQNSSENFRLATAVAGYGMLLRESQFKGNISYEKVLEMLRGTRDNDKNGYRKELRNLVRKTMRLDNLELEDLTLNDH